MTTLTQLQPQAVWYWFEQLCAIPRPTFHEQALGHFLMQQAEARGLSAEQDARGNVRIHKAATAGMADRAPVAIQAHMDMVAQKTPDSLHDFARDPIHTRIDDGWVSAEQTTLGADNGIGLAMGLAVLFEADMSHPDLTLIVTVEEEVGMGGAMALSPSWLTMPYLINLDSEEEGRLFIGCAGGRDVNFTFPLCWQAAEGAACCVRVEGLQGGHSGADIHQGLGNANVLLARLLASVYEVAPFALADLAGGELRNVITREAAATIMLPENQAAPIVAATATVLQAELAHTEPNLHVSVQAVDTPLQAASLADTRRVLDGLLCLPNGVLRMSDVFAGVVETSSSMGVVKTNAEGVQIHCLMRSLLASPKDALGQRMEALARLAGATVRFDADYPGWAPNADSPLLQQAKVVFERHFGQAPSLDIIHAGLECGLLSGKAPHLDMVSFGPTITGAHSPKERVNIASVAKNWAVLLDLLQHIPKA